MGVADSNITGHPIDWDVDWKRRRIYLFIDLIRAR